MDDSGTELEDAIDENSLKSKSVSCGVSSV